MNKNRRTFLISGGVIIVVVTLILMVVGYINSQINTQVDQQLRATHFKSSTPLHDEVYAARPINVTINFTVPVLKNSRLQVFDEAGNEKTAGEVRNVNGKTLQKDLQDGLGTGAYLVKYSACFEGEGCHEGQYTFHIDTTKQSSYTDLRERKAVVIAMSGESFVPQNVIISPGTEVMWRNEDPAEHFIHSAPYPEHTYYPSLASKALKQGARYSHVFTARGHYAYHCKSHVSSMRGNVIVSD